MSIARNIALNRRAVRERWVSDEMAVRIVDEMEHIALTAPSTRDRVQAARVVMLAANIDTQREGNHVTDRGEEARAASARMMQLAKDHPDLYDQLARAVAEQQQREYQQVLPQLPADDADPPVIGQLDDGRNGTLHP